MVIETSNYAFAGLHLWEGNPFPDCRGKDASPTSFKLDKVETVKVHDLVPCSHEVMHKCLRSVITRVDFRDGSKLRVRSEHEVDAGAGPTDFPRPAVAPLEHIPQMQRRRATRCSCPAGSRRNQESMYRIAS